jgi:hypothetical protein
MVEANGDTVAMIVSLRLKINVSRFTAGHAGLPRMKCKASIGSVIASAMGSTSTETEVCPAGMITVLGTFGLIFPMAE